MKFSDYLAKKDKSVLVGQLIGLALLLFLFWVVFKYESDKDLLLGLSVTTAGIALGWTSGILLSPQSEFNDEKAKFTKIQQLIATFITGGNSYVFKNKL